MLHFMDPKFHEAATLHPTMLLIKFINDKKAVYNSDNLHYHLRKYLVSTAALPAPAALSSTTLVQSADSCCCSGRPSAARPTNIPSWSIRRPSSRILSEKSHGPLP